ncbi:uncharacterized [Tachysurus ichikawai]
MPVLFSDFSSLMDVVLQSSPLPSSELMLCDVIARGDPLFSPLVCLTALQLGRREHELVRGSSFYLGRGALRCQLIKASDQV